MIKIVICLVLCGCITACSSRSFSNNYYSNFDVKEEDDCNVIEKEVDRNTKIKVSVKVKITDINHKSKVFFNGYTLTYKTEKGTDIEVLNCEEKVMAIGGYMILNSFDKELELPEGVNELILNNNGESKL